MENKIVITISREFGSGGRMIGESVAKKLGIEFYDRALIDLAAQNSGFSPEYISAYEQRVTSSMLFNIAVNGTYSLGLFPAESNNPDKLFVTQSNIIKDLAEKDSCVIIGRCADYVLRDAPDCLHLFIHADKELRLERIVTEYGIEKGKANAELAMRDKQRQNHYQHYTDRRWGAAKNYNATLDSGYFGIDATVQCIVDLVQNRLLAKA